jgi:hypothetical protein
MTPGYYGSSPKDTPYFVGISIIIFSIVLFVDTLLNKKGLLKHDLKLTRKGELVRLLQYSFVLVLVPIIMPIFGFYTTIVLSMLSILLLSKVRNIFIIALSLSGIILAIYLFLEKVSHTKLPTGLFI